MNTERLLGPKNREQKVWDVIAGSNRRWRLSMVPRPSEVTTLRSSRSSHLNSRRSPLASQPYSFLGFMFLS
ncbi:uncharacterized protein N7529_001492 [Penicillium soppii]|uniref:uncharacterized protein n=1 Tax=Penicillium soppii TaxID=69789 RepID=UPI00254867A2|nr:uncharacterized protein N7529_001492 [Penicillium soppii]KAJ5875908.1 hypothetical protein N7529_001492 [Penicillium soppii]